MLLRNEAKLAERKVGFILMLASWGRVDSCPKLTPSLTVSGQELLQSEGGGSGAEINSQL